MSSLSFERANKLREAGDLTGLQTLFEKSNDEQKGAVLNALTGKPGNPTMGPGLVQLAIAAVENPFPETRFWVCQVIQNQNAWKVDVSPALGVLLTLLRDPVPKVRMMAAYATGNVCKRKWDMRAHFEALRVLLRDKDLYVPPAAASALAEFGRTKFDLSPAVGNLVRLLSSKVEYDEPRKQAGRVLLIHAKTSSQACDDVRKAVAKAKLDVRQKEVTRFLKQLEAL